MCLTFGIYLSAQHEFSHDDEIIVLFLIWITLYSPVYLLTLYVALKIGYIT